MTTSAQEPAKLAAAAPQSSPAICPAHAHSNHAKTTERRAQGMGFSQTATTHHFPLRPNGGAIQVEANDPKDTRTVNSIRAHFTLIARAFSSGDFDIPMFPARLCATRRS